MTTKSKTGNGGGAAMAIEKFTRQALTATASDGARRSLALKVDALSYPEMHLWLCHEGNPARCLDGCDTSADPLRATFTETMMQFTDPARWAEIMNVPDARFDE
jgi:hypothetical protein